MNDLSASGRTCTEAPANAAVEASDDAVFGQLYAENATAVRAVAASILRDDDAAADITQDTFLAAWKALPTLAEPEALRNWLLRVARNTALDHLRSRRRAHPVDAAAMSEIEMAEPEGAASNGGMELIAGAGAITDPARETERANSRELVRTAAATLGPKDSSLFHLYVAADLSPAEIADVVGSNRNAVNQALHRLRHKLARAVRAAVLWRGGRPSCEALDGALRSVQVDRFGHDAVALIDRHAARCQTCTVLSRDRLRPGELYGVVPGLAAALQNARRSVATARRRLQTVWSNLGRRVLWRRFSAPADAQSSLCAAVVLTIVLASGTVSAPTRGARADPAAVSRSPQTPIVANAADEPGSSSSDVPDLDAGLPGASLQPSDSGAAQDPPTAGLAEDPQPGRAPLGDDPDTEPGTSPANDGASAPRGEPAAMPLGGGQPGGPAAEPADPPDAGSGSQDASPPAEQESAVATQP